MGDFYYERPISLLLLRRIDRVAQHVNLLILAHLLLSLAKLRASP
jgi:hypothetical protein